MNEKAYLFTYLDVGTYQYAGNNHAVSGIYPLAAGYTPQPVSVSYYSFDRPSSVTLGNEKITMDYGPNRQRSVSRRYTGNVLQSTRYYSGDYEKEIIGGVTKEFDYIYSPEGLAAIAVKTGGTRSLNYVHTDHLGSLRVIADGNKNIVSRYRYDAWGKRTLVAGNNNITNRGFTGHEHLPEFGLINMNARMYDLVLGRFLSPDPFVVDGTYSQDFNRYSYVRNNPLIYTDPTGENPLLIAAIIIGSYLGGSAANDNFNPAKWDYGNWQTYAGIAVGGLSGWAGASIGAGITASVLAGGSGTIGAGIAGGMVGGMASGGINGFGMTLVMGSNLNDALGNGIQGAVMGGFSGALSGGVGAAIGDFTGVAGSSFKNGMYELGHSALKGAATGLAGGAMMAAMTQDASYLWKGTGMAGLRIGLMGSTIIPPGIKGRFDADDAAFGIKNSYPIYRRGGIMRYFTPGITLGRNMMVNAKYAGTNWYDETLAHERAHIYQQKVMGSFNFYRRILYEYIINPGYWGYPDPYNNPNCLDYWANQYMKLTP